MTGLEDYEADVNRRARAERAVRLNRSIPRTENTMTRTVDQDDLQRTLDYLSERHGDIEVLPADSATGSVTLIAEDGAMYRFTTQSITVPVGSARRRSDRFDATGDRYES